MLAPIAASFAQPPEDTCCEMTILPGSDSPAELAITTTNLNQPVVGIRAASAERDYRVRVALASGKEASRTEHGEQLLAPGEGSRRYIELKTGETFTQKLNLRRIFKLRARDL